MQCVQQYPAQMPLQRTLTLRPLIQLLGGEVEQSLQAMVKPDETRLLEQTAKPLVDQPGFLGRLGGEIENQHVVAAPPREGMGLMARHQTGVQAIDGTTLPHHFEIRAPLEPHDQLMLRVGMAGGLGGKIKDSSANHTRLPVVMALHSSLCARQSQAGPRPLKCKPIDTI